MATTLQAPLRGINKNWSTSSQPTFTSPDMNNVRPRSVLNDRLIIGQRPALIKAFAQQLGSGNPVVAMAQVTISNETAMTKYVRKLVAASNNAIYWENNSNVMTLLAGATIDTGEPVVMIEAFQKVFVVNGTNLDVIDFVNVKLTLSAPSATATRGDILTQANTNAVMVVDFVNPASTGIYGKVTSGTFNNSDLVTSTGTVDDFTPSAVSTVGTPLFYTWTVYPDIDLGSSADFGIIPTQATIAALYRGRVFLAGDKDNPHQWKGPRADNPWDWLFFANDVFSPVAGNDSLAGQLGDIVTALIPFADNYFVMAGASSIWVMLGAPIGGALRQVGFDTGIWSRESWTLDGEGNLYFLGTDGIYRLKVGFAKPENLTMQVLPKFRDDWALDSTLHKVTLAYDQTRHGLLICKTTIASGVNENYWFDLRVGDQTIPGGFFPETYPDECGVHSSIFYDATTESKRQILLGCNDGYIRTFDENTKDDNIGATSQKIESDCLYALRQIATDGARTGLLRGLWMVAAGGGAGGTQPDTDSFDYQIFKADEAETIIENVEAATPVPAFSGTVTGPGKSKRKGHRASGTWIGIRFINTTAGETWAVDRVLIDSVARGMVR